MQETDRLVALRRITMAVAAENIVLTGCLAPIDKGGLDKLISTGKANPMVVKTLKGKTGAEGKLRHANYIRNLAHHIGGEPPSLLGCATARNPGDASLPAPRPAPAA